MASNTVRLTTAQAILRYFGAQKVSRDGAIVPLVGGVFGIFGHGNGAGFGHALSLGEGTLVIKTLRRRLRLIAFSILVESTLLRVLSSAD